MSIRVILAKICLVTFYCNSLIAQNLPSQIIDQEDGLPSNTIYVVRPHLNGFIWFGTSNGLCRFDGKNFVTLDHPELMDREILSLKQDHFGNTWASNLSGQILYVHQNEMKIRVMNAALAIQTGRDIFLVNEQLFITHSSQIPSGQSPFRFLLASFNDQGEIQQTKHLSEEIDFITKFAEYNGTIAIRKSFLVEEHPELYILDPKSCDLKIFDNIKGVDHRSSIPFLLSDSLTVLVKNRLRGLEFYYKGEHFSDSLESSDGINNVCLIDSNLYVLRKKGISVYQTNSFHESPKTYFNDISCNHMEKDREGNLWIGTTTQGLLIIPNSDLLTYDEKNSNLASSDIHSMIYDDEKQLLILGQNNGQVSTFDQTNFSNYQFQISGRTRSMLKLDAGGYAISGDAGSCFLNDDFGIQEYQIFSTKITIQNRDKDLYHGTSAFLSYSKYDPISQTFSPKIHKIFSKRTYALIEDPEGTIWIGTTKGLFYLDNQVKPATLDGQIIENNISHLSLTTDSSIWAATTNNGIFKFKNEKIIERYSLSNGLLSNHCKKVYERNGQIWVLYSKGINIITQRKEIQTITKNDGLPTNEINELHFGENFLWLATRNGLVRMPYDFSPINVTPPICYINNLTVGQSNTSLLKPLSFRHDNNNLEIQYGGIAYRARGDIHFKYRLKGSEDEWHMTQTNTVNYSALRPGAYTFEIFAVNEDGIHSLEPATISFKILKPFWLTWWFILLSALVVASVVGLIFHRRYKQIINRKNQELQFDRKINRVRQQALQTQMNPHFIFNSMNAIQQFMTTNNNEVAMGYLTKFARLVRLIFEYSKKERIDLEDELGFLNLYLQLEKLRFRDRVDIHLIVDTSIKNCKDEITIPPLLIQPIIENAFKHGLFHKTETGNLWIHFSHQDNTLICSVKDDGIGRTAAQTIRSKNNEIHVASGIEIVRERINILNEISSNAQLSELKIIDLRDKKQQALGTEVIIKIST